MSRKRSLGDMLAETLARGALSRGEKKALEAVLAEQAPEAHRLAVLRSQCFSLVREELSNPADRTRLDWLESVLNVLSSGAAPPRVSIARFSPGEGCRAEIRRSLRLARRAVDICVFTITDDTITDAIVAADRRQVAIRVITDNEKAFDRGSDIVTLRRLGIPVRVDRSVFHMHHKFALFDNVRLLTGSYNWTRSAADKNEENLIVTDDAKLIGPFRRLFDRRWRELA